MKNLVTILIICSFSCVSCQSSSKRTREWEVYTKYKLSKLGKLNSDYNKIIRNLERKGLNPDLQAEEIFEKLKKEDLKTKDDYWSIFGSYSTLSLEIRNNISDLWNITGHCLFDDIPCEEILNRTNIIIKRYENFLRKNKAKEKSMILLSGLKKNIELLKTNYCRLTIVRITYIVSFDYIIGEVYDNPCPDIQEESRVKIYEEMKKWFQENENNLIWNDDLQIFLDSRTGLSFRLPKDVIDLI